MLGLPVDPHPPLPGPAELDAVRERAGAIARRRRGRRAAGSAIGLVLALAAGSSLALRPTGSATTVVAGGTPQGVGTCPVTPTDHATQAPPPELTSELGGGTKGLLGSGGLWVVPPVGETDLVWNPARRTYDLKVGWWRSAQVGELVITGERLDQPGSLTGETADPSGYRVPGFLASTLHFPQAGCWRVTGALDGAELSFVVDIGAEAGSGGLAVRPSDPAPAVPDGAQAPTTVVDGVGPGRRGATLGDKVPVAQGNFEGSPWWLMAYDSVEGGCVELAVQGGEGRRTTRYCGEVTDGLVAVEGHGPTHVGVHGGVDKGAALVRVELADGSSVDAVPAPGGERFPTDFFAAVLPVDARPVEVVALDAGGRELARHPLPSGSRECPPASLPGTGHAVVDC